MIEYSNPQGMPVIIAGLPQSGSTLLYNIIIGIISCICNRKEIGMGDMNGITSHELLTVVMTTNRPMVMKTHGLDLNSRIMLTDPKTKVFTTCRDLRDCVASHLRKSEILKNDMINSFSSLKALSTNKDNSRSTISSLDDLKKLLSIDFSEEQWRLHRIKALVCDNLHIYESWRDKSDYEFNYEKFKESSTESKISQIRYMASALNISLRPQQAYDILHLVEVILPASAHETNTKPSEGNFLSQSHMTNHGKIKGYQNVLTDAEIQVIEDIAGDWLREKGYLT